MLISAAQAPLYEIKANLFKALAHPARIRILELLAAAPDTAAPVSFLHKVVTSVRSTNVVAYRIAHPKIAELLAIARAFLLDTLKDSNEQLRLAQDLPSTHLPGGHPAGTSA